MMIQRSLIDRRRWKSTPAFPFLDSKGVRVLEDRRKRPDRRLEGIKAEWLSMTRETGKALRR